MSRLFEFHAYAGDEHGHVATNPEVTNKEFNTTEAARSHAGKLAMQVNGPVDVARAYEPPVQPTRDWADRYITTASPSEHHARGYRLERLS